MRKRNELFPINHTEVGPGFFTKKPLGLGTRLSPMFQEPRLRLTLKVSRTRFSRRMAPASCQKDNGAEKNDLRKRRDAPLWAAQTRARNTVSWYLQTTTGCSRNASPAYGVSHEDGAAGQLNRSSHAPREIRHAEIHLVTVA